jgi:hypothetical protein
MYIFLQFETKIGISTQKNMGLLGFSAREGI